MFAQLRDFAFCSLCPPQQVGWGCTRSWVVTQPGQQTWTDQRDIPGHILSCLTLKTGAEEGGGWGFLASVSAVALKLTRHWSALWEMLSNCLYVTFFLLPLVIKLYLCQAVSFFLLLFLLFPTFHWVGRVGEWLCA